MNKIYQKSFPGAKNAGFTLLELLVVVLIIGILAAVALPQYQSAVARSRYQQMLLVAGAVVRGQTLYHLANGFYARQFDELDIEMPSGGRIAGGGEDNEWIHYPWGYCYFTTVYVQCFQTYAGYEYHYDGTRFCIARNETDIGHQICRQETGSSAYTTNSATNASYYQYK